MRRTTQKDIENAEHDESGKTTVDYDHAESVEDKEEDDADQDDEDQDDEDEA